jgi:hypothetical protein
MRSQYLAYPYPITISCGVLSVQVLGNEDELWTWMIESPDDTSKLNSPLSKDGVRTLLLARIESGGSWRIKLQSSIAAKMNQNLYN